MGFATFTLQRSVNLGWIERIRYSFELGTRFNISKVVEDINLDETLRKNEEVKTWIVKLLGAVQNQHFFNKEVSLRSRNLYGEPGHIFSYSKLSNFPN